MTDRHKYTKAETKAFIAYREFVKELLGRAHADVAAHRLDHLSFHVLWFLTNMKYLKTPNKQMFAGPTSLAEEMGSSRSPIQRALKKLETTGYLVLVSKGRLGLKKCPSAYKLGDGNFVGLLGPTAHDHKVPGDPHSDDCGSQETHTELFVGPRRPQSILEASDSISGANPTRTTQEGTRSDVELDGDQPDQPDAGSPACASAHAHSGEYSSWHTRSRAADPNSRPTEPAPDPTLFADLTGERQPQSARPSRRQDPDLTPDPTIFAGLTGVVDDAARSAWWQNLRRELTS